MTWPVPAGPAPAGWFGPPAWALPPVPAAGQADGQPEGPYTGPPPTGRYGAPPVVPGAAPWRFAPQPQPWPSQPWPPPPGRAPPWGSAAPLLPPELPKGTPPHDSPQPFLRVMRSRDWAWWRPLLGLLLFTVLYAVAATVVVLVALLTGAFPDLALLDLVDPLVLLVTNASLIVAIPIVWLCWAVCHGMGIGWSSSVLARLRWRLFAPLTARALLALGAGIGAAAAVSVVADELDVAGPDGSFGWLLAVVLLTTPLQSAAEEYVFRGYLSQAIAGWVRGPRAGAVVAGVLTAALFSAAHVPPDFLTFLDRFAFGLAASAVVWLTGGLEAAIVLHAVNNVLVFILAGLIGEGVTTSAVPDSAGLSVVALDLLAMSGYVLLVARWRRWAHPQTRTDALDLRRLVPTRGPRTTPGAGPVPAPAWPPPPGWAQIPARYAVPVTVPRPAPGETAKETGGVSPWARPAG